jgi:hypothetical protein
VISAVLFVFNISPALAHHPAEDIVDEDIYAMIDSMVADTPHADMTFVEMGGGMTEITIPVDSLKSFENIIVNDDLLEYIERLDGVVDVSLVYDPDDSITLRVNQVK